jgi:hypothetical protein
MSVSKVKNVGRHSALFLPLPQVGTQKFQPIALERWRALAVEDRAPVRSAAMVDIVGPNFVALIVDTVHRQLRWLIVAPREQLWVLYDGMLDSHGGRSRGTVIVSAPFIGAEQRRQGGDGGHVDCESPQFMTQALAFRIAPTGDGGPVEVAVVPSQWPTGGPPGVAAGQALLTAEGAVTLQDAPVVTVTDSDGDSTDGVVVPPN